jgi:hypothetical protein
LAVENIYIYCVLRYIYVPGGRVIQLAEDIMKSNTTARQSRINEYYKYVYIFTTQPTRRLNYIAEHGICMSDHYENVCLQYPEDCLKMKLSFILG